MSTLRTLPVMLVLVWPLAEAIAQTSPTPGPTAPQPPNQPLAQSGASSGRELVVNPTIEECQKGWNPTLRWTKEQFAVFCAKLKAAK
jgi:hypothetical protein